MADARALLRAHRAENRIKHPHAAYSDAGKLLCKLCHETVKSESLWDGHIRGPSHKKRLQALQQQTTTPNQSTPAADESSIHSKRKHDDVDEPMSDADGEDTELIRKKRSKVDIGGGGSSSGSDEKMQTPPAHSRRTSGTPIQGVEIAIPSRPATPLAGSNSATSTPKNAPVGRSPLIGPESTSAPALPISTESLAVPHHHNVPAAPISTSNHTASPDTNIATTAAAAAAAIMNATTPSATTSQQAQSPNNDNNNNNSVDESEWAAFEAEIADAEAVADPSTITTSTNTNTGDAYAHASISAPAMTAEQIAAKSQEEENERRKHLLEAEMADEREDATRALEAEFEEMEELEGRVRRLKERREELRRGSAGGAISNSGDAAVHVMTTTSGAKGLGVGSGGKENREGGVEEEDDDDDDDDEEDEWDGFRFRT